MINKITALLLIFPLIMALNGCAALIIGGAAGALGAYAVSKDTIQGDTDKPYDSLWESAYLVAKMRGTIKVEDSLKGYIELQTSSGKVWIRLIKLTGSTTRLRVSARQFKLPNITLAQDIFVKIMEQASELSR
ncbi:MAG: DUF3568 family protein [Candidatus Omnitrophica bacterium]|nr:DUF3568 family protein [Candidatus Omnitrophota bacterium]